MASICRLKDNLENLIYEMEKTSNKVVLVVLVASLLVGSSLALSLEVPKIYGFPYPSFFGFCLSFLFSLLLLRLMLKR